MDNHTRLRILVVASDPLLCLGMEHLFTKSGEFQISGTASTAASARELFHRECPDVTVVDFAPEFGLTLELLKELTADATASRCVVLGEHFDTDLMERLLHAGVVGCVVRPCSIEDLREACLHASRAHPWVSPCLVEALMVSLADGSMHSNGTIHPALSDREHDVFQLLGAGRSVVAIAAALGISHKTVETHCERMKVKLGVLSLDQLRRHAKEG